MAVEMKQRSPTQHSFDNGMVVSGSWGAATTSHYVARGQSKDLGCFQWSGNCSTQCVSDQEVHAVRCCSDSAREGWNNTRCPEVWQNLNEWQDCAEMTYYDAVGYCASQGARLCTEEELNRDCAKQPSCHFDKRLVWTSRSCGTTMDCDVDVQPAIEEENPTCLTQKANTDKCDLRAEGNLTDGLCAKTCETCGACEDVLGFADEWAGIGTWGGTCAEWAATGSPCDRAAEDWGYSQQGEDDILGNCTRSCGRCSEQESPIFLIQNITPSGKGYRIRANNSLSSVICLYVETDRPVVGDLWVSVTTRSEIYDFIWHEAYDCDEDVETSNVGGCAEGGMWPENWYNTYVGLVNGSINNTASNPITSSWRTSTAHLTRNGVEKPVDNGTSDSGPPSVHEGSTLAVEMLVTILCIVALGLVGVLFLLLLCARTRRQPAKVPDSLANGKDLEHGESSTSKAHDSFISSLTDPSMSDFAHAKLNDIVNAGLKEHWLILPQDLTLPEGSIGHGTFGEVSRGKLFGATEVAVKVARKSTTSAASGQATMALANELALLRRVRHPNIVLFHGSTVMKREADLVLCLVLEWVEGADLQVYLKARKDNGSFIKDCIQAVDKQGNLAEALPEHKLLVDTAVAMQYLHSQRPPIVHRDLKPGNVLVDTTSTPHRAKIADFGLSAILSSEELSGLVGTSAYMAPEVKNRQKYDTKADVYSFGCILKQLHHLGREVATAANAKALSGSTDADKIEAKVEAALSLFRVLAEESCRDDPSSRPTFTMVLATLTGKLSDLQRESSDHQDSSTALGSSWSSSAGIGTSKSHSTGNGPSKGIGTSSPAGSGTVGTDPPARVMSL